MRSPPRPRRPRTPCGRGTEPKAASRGAGTLPDDNKSSAVARIYRALPRDRPAVCAGSQRDRERLGTWGTPVRAPAARRPHRCPQENTKNSPPYRSCATNIASFVLPTWRRTPSVALGQLRGGLLFWGSPLTARRGRTSHAHEHWWTPRTAHRRSWPPRPLRPSIFMVLLNAHRRRGPLRHQPAGAVTANRHVGDPCSRINK